MVRWRGLLIIFTLVMSLPLQAALESVQLNYRKILNFPVKFVSVDLNDPEVTVTVATAPGFPRGLESWGRALTRLQPDAAINGTYFCVHSYMPVGDVAVEGKLRYRGVVGTALCITPDNRVVMRPGPRQAKPDWRGYRTVLCAGPRLLQEGQVMVNARAEGFRDSRVLGSAPRSAVAWRPDNLLLLLTIETDISLKNLAYVCQHLGATEAMALDGGNSSGLYASGRTVTRPGRGLSNIVAVYATPERFAAAAPHLVPARVPVLASLLSPVRPLPTAIATGLARPPFHSPPPPPRVTDVAPHLVRFAHPAGTAPVSGMVPVLVEVTPEAKICWTSLRINGQLRALSNVWPLEYQWDSTKEDDGLYTLEVTGWSLGEAIVSRTIRQIIVRNSVAQSENTTVAQRIEGRTAND
jgi:hypothetical protein